MDAERPPILTLVAAMIIESGEDYILATDQVGAFDHLDIRDSSMTEGAS